MFPGTVLVQSEILAESLGDLIGISIDTESERFRGLLPLVGEVLKLWTDLRCQPGYYAFDDGLKTTSAFDAETMEDITFFLDRYDFEDEANGPIVTGIVARGVSRMECRWSEDILTRVSKTQVVLGMDNE